MAEPNVDPNEALGWLLERLSEVHGEQGQFIARVVWRRLLGLPLDAVDALLTANGALSDDMDMCDLLREQVRDGRAPLVRQDWLHGAFMLGPDDGVDDGEDDAGPELHAALTELHAAAVGWVDILHHEGPAAGAVDWSTRVTAQDAYLAYLAAQERFRKAVDQAEALLAAMVQRAQPVPEAELMDQVPCTATEAGWVATDTTTPAQAQAGDLVTADGRARDLAGTCPLLRAARIAWRGRPGGGR